MARFSLKKMCTPAKLYLAISAIFLFSAIFYKISALTLIIKVVFVGIWTLLLNWLCSKRLGNLAWIIVILPFAFLFLSVFTTMDAANYREGLTTSPNPPVTTGPAPTPANSIHPNCVSVPDEYKEKCTQLERSIENVPPKPTNALDPTSNCYSLDVVKDEGGRPRCIENVKKNVAASPQFFSGETNFRNPPNNFIFPETVEELSTNYCPSMRIDDMFYRPYVPKDGKCVLRDGLNAACNSMPTKEDYSGCIISQLGVGGSISIPDYLYSLSTQS